MGKCNTWYDLPFQEYFVLKQSSRNFGTALVILALVSPIFAQQSSKSRTSPQKSKTSSPTAKRPTEPKSVPTATPKVDPALEKERFDTAIAAIDPTEKAELLVKFIAEFPRSEFKIRAEESLAGSRAAIADERLTAGDTAGALRLFKVAINDAPKPYSDRLFSAVVATIPANLWVRGHRAESIEIARLIESNVATDANKLLLLSTFYLGSENGDEAKRLAEAALKLDEKNATAHQTLATAHRINFDLESAAASFAKAVELDPESSTAKRSLADMKRAIGKADEAEAIYRSILAVDSKDSQSRTGLVLSLFEQGKRSDAEAEMSKALEDAPGNVVLLGGAAYWYAVNKDANKAVEYAQMAIDKEPRYIWSHVALGRGLMLQGKPVEAEQVLMAARKYGNFPTLQYEIASARFAAGFFREAVEELNKSFSIRNGVVSTRLGGRIEVSSDSFTAAIANERRASIFAPSAADNPDDAGRLKALMELTNQLGSETKEVPAIVAAADSFSAGSDNMAVHRKLYAANLLLQKEVAPQEAMKLSGEAVAGLDRSLDVPNPGAAVMATELYEARNVSFSRDDFLLIPEVPKQTLNALMRGRVEETTGLALLKQGKAEEASVRFRRALTVLPKDSAWWRSTTWNLGSSLAAEGKDKEALDALISSYTTDRPNVTRYIVIEQLWIKVNGSREGLEQKIGPNPLLNFTASAKTEPTPEGSPEPSSSTTTTTEDNRATAETKPTPEPSPDTRTETAQPSPSPAPTPATAETEVKATPTPEPSPAPTSSAEPERITAEKIPEPSPTPPETIVAKVDGPPSESKTSTGQIFEPVIITIPKPAAEKKTAAEEKTETSASTEEKKDDPQPSTSTEPTRPRVVEGKVITGELLPCEIGVSQETVSLINNGGSIAVLVSIEQGEDIRLVAGMSNSPADVEVAVDPAITDVAGRAMFVIKSVSEKTGLYHVTFRAPCGKREINVRVR